MTFAPPVADILFAMRHVGGLDETIASGRHGELSLDLVGAVLDEAGRFAAERIAPLNRGGDTAGCRFQNGAVTTPPGWREAYAAWVEAGWQGLAAPEEYGGQGLPALVRTGVAEMASAASMAFSLGPLLTEGAVEALAAHGSEELKRLYLPPLVAGRWMGTMCLTEPQAGSDLATLRTRAEPAGDGSYRLAGSKIFISYGEHDLAENIVHLMLARLPDAPAGSRGISLFLVPKFLPDAEGRPGARNGAFATAIEEKMGLHGSPTCAMSFGGDGTPAVGWLVGEPNRGLAAMFTMMNNERLAIGVEGVGIAERALQAARAYAAERRQGRRPGAEGERPIAEHPDVRRMLMRMAALTAAARAICLMTAAAIDEGRHAAEVAARVAGHERAALLTPVAKAFATDVGVEVASLGIQVHGGAGYIEETGAAQHLRDARIAPIYEGTNGIQAIDLVTRKITLADGAAMRGAVARLRQSAEGLRAAPGASLAGIAPHLEAATDSLERATAFLAERLAAGETDAALAGASPYLTLFGTALGGAALADIACAAAAAIGRGDSDPAHAARIAAARFFALTISPAAGGLEAAVTCGGEALEGGDALTGTAA